MNNNLNCSRNITKQFCVKRTSDYLLVFFHESNVFYELENICPRHPKFLHYVYSQDLLHSQGLISEVQPGYRYTSSQRYFINMAIAPKVEATSAARTTFFCHLCQFVVVYTFPLHYSRSVTYAALKFGISNVII